jgi:selenide,water dikinase
VVDDPFIFGQVAAANALSDIYAMGGVPRTVLNLVAFDTELYGEDTLAAILAGGLDKVRESGAVLLGGHTVKDKEPKFGLAVTGTARPSEIWRKDGAQPGDALYLTKPIGTGVIVKAIKDGKCDPEGAASATEAMRELNRAGADAVREAGGAHAVTDVTGFGLLGHAREMAVQSGVTLSIDYAMVPVHPGAVALAELDRFPSGSRDNFAYVADDVTFARDLPEAHRLLLADAVTSGGLLIAIDPSRAAKFERSARTAMSPRRIGTVEVLGAQHIIVR